MPAFQPYWGKLTVRNDRGDRENVGIIRSPIRVSILPDRLGMMQAINRHLAQTSPGKQKLKRDQ